MEATTHSVESQSEGARCLMLRQKHSNAASASESHMVSARRFLISNCFWFCTRVRTRWLSLIISLFLLYIICFVVVSLRNMKYSLLQLSTSKFPTDPSNNLQGESLMKVSYKLAWVNNAETISSQNLLGDLQVAKAGERLYLNQESILDDPNNNKIDEQWSSNDDTTNRDKRGKSKRKFVFVFRFYEQLGMTTNNLLALASFAKYENRKIVAPFVNNSRMSGLPGGVSHHWRKTYGVNFAPLSFYYDVNHFNTELRTRSYGTLTSLRDFATNCNNRMNVLVHFLYRDAGSMQALTSWYNLQENEASFVYRQARANGGWIPCPFVKKSKLAKQLGFKISRYICVDPEIIRTMEELEKKILKRCACLGIVLWKGNGTNRAHFPLNSSITKPIRLPDLKFNHRLLNIAANFVEEYLGKDFIAVHVRAERHYLWKGINVTLRCIRKLVKRVQETQMRYKVVKVFLASDLTDYGSDTLINDGTDSDRAFLMKYLLKSLNRPVRFSPAGVLYDTGAIAIVEMHILAAGSRLFTLGSGNFQNWIVDLFQLRNDARRTHRMCEMK